ncbi:hypothetical protein HPC49_11530 [Pyxidicoccus fallax]|uniref:Uncharacterized protein n=1 Tax=Pyxidicoccus fallax TaxID=394095 RepID=A0A848LL88_9BACT|nr:hypothetical protein [Pyxidicoccus fallax]NMO18433.1 hypothetical protein [Pyxidicoccus fallax]NPC78870.1 hypothetical protein [Pyxidicoccus fallax]
MGAFQQFLNEKQITPDTLLRLSRQLEAHGDTDRVLVRKRADKRRDKEKQGKSYQELELGKPKSGRGVSTQQLQAALGDQPLPTRVRGKLVRAVNAVLTKKGGGAVDAAALFGAVPVRKGDSAKKAAS